MFNFSKYIKYIANFEKYNRFQFFLLLHLQVKIN